MMGHKFTNKYQAQYFNMNLGVLYKPHTLQLEDVQGKPYSEVSSGEATLRKQHLVFQSCNIYLYLFVEQCVTSVYYHGSVHIFADCMNVL